MAACRECARRSWLLAKLSVRLDYSSRDESRLLALLELADEELIEAIAGRWRRELRAAWERFEHECPRSQETFEGAGHAVKEDGESRERTGTPITERADVETVCAHSPGYPRALHECAGAPRTLHVRGGAQRLARLASEPTVAIVGSARATDHGMEMARSLARALSASEVTVVSVFANGIGAGALAGALAGGGRCIAAMASGVDVIAPASRRECYERTVARGCAIAEPPCGHPQRRWCEPARARIVAGLARLVIVVEADGRASELRVARIAQMLGRPVAALPGRVTSPASIGTNLLLREGAPLIRDARDALELLYGVEGSCREGSREADRRDAPGATRLEPRLQAILERVGAGSDTPGKLSREGANAGETLLALAELEVMGLLGRGDGGRYVLRTALRAPAGG